MNSKNAVQWKVSAKARSLLSERTKLPGREKCLERVSGDSTQSRDIYLVEEGIVQLSMLIRQGKCTFSIGPL
jgi:hypothetical protein